MTFYRPFIPVFTTVFTKLEYSTLLYTYNYPTLITKTLGIHLQLEIMTTVNISQS